MAAAARGGHDRSLPRPYRLTRSSEIRAAFRRGKRSRTAHLDVFDFASPAAHPRIGVVVPRYRHRVVDRNLVKRRLREALRRDVLPRLAAADLAVDVLVRARGEAYGVPYAVMRDELMDWLERRWPHASS